MFTRLVTTLLACALVLVAALIIINPAPATQAQAVGEKAYPPLTPGPMKTYTATATLNDPSPYPGIDENKVGSEPNKIRMPLILRQVPTSPVGGAGATFTPIPTPTPIATPTRIATSTPIPPMPTNTPRPTSTPIPTRTSTPTPVPTPCTQDEVQLLKNWSFGENFAYWNTYGNPAIDGWHAGLEFVPTDDNSAWLGDLTAAGGNNARDEIQQPVVVPLWAHTAMFTWLSWASTTETHGAPAYDRLTIELTDSAGNIITSGYIYNGYGTQEHWVEWHLNTDKYGSSPLYIGAYRGQTIWVKIRVTTDSSNPSVWFVDDTAMFFRSNCGDPLMSIPNSRPMR